MGTELTIAQWAQEISRELSPAQRGAAVADFAMTAVTAVQIANRVALGYSPAYRSFVDGVASTALERVKLDGGKIEFEFEISQIDDVLRWIAKALYDASPFRSGDYRNGHTLLADGEPIDVNGNIPQDVSEFCFVNVVPYARKIEIGTTEGGRPFVVQVPPNVYERVTQRAQHEFGERANIRFEFRSVDEGKIGRWSRTSSARGMARHHRGNKPARTLGEWLRRQPAIIVKGLAR